MHGFRGILVTAALAAALGVAAPRCSNGPSAKAADDAPDLPGPADQAASTPDGLPDLTAAPDRRPGPDTGDVGELPRPDGRGQDAHPDGADLSLPEVAPDVPPVEVVPGPEFDRFCLQGPWDDSLEEGTPGQLGGEYLGYYPDFPALTLETMKVIPPHPFWVTGIRVAFAAGTGTARIRLMYTFGRSYPHSYPDVLNPEANLMEPVDLEIENPDPDQWLTIDVAQHAIFLEPTQHYMIVYQHWQEEPNLALESLVEGEYSRGLILVPKQFEAYGIEGNYRMELVGHYFCQWQGEDHWFGLDGNQPWTEAGARHPAVTDLNGDDHDDLVVLAGGPAAYLGDGQGGFQAPPEPLFPTHSKAGMTVMGDLDNDGDVDVFAPTWVGGDGDADGFTIVEGDCNDKDPAVHPDADEVPDNGLDDDCDGVVDDGKDGGDEDGDGISIADGDCDDTDDAVHPEAEEALDGLDNDCDLQVDEDFPNRVWLNQGDEGFVELADAGVEILDPTGAAALGDANGDGILDVYWGNWLVHYPDSPAFHDVFALGVGDGTFVIETEAWEAVPDPARPCYGVTWNDYNNDGWQDIWVGNYQLNPNFMWHNNGDGTFTDLAQELGLVKDSLGFWGGHTYGGDFGDFDNDGDLDLFEPNLAHPRTMPFSDPSRFMVNQGPPDYKFVDRRELLGFIYDEGDVNSAFADYDNDMDLDIVIATLYTGHYSKLYRNDGEAGFVDVTYETGTAVHDAVAAMWSDVDEDGDLDLFIADRHGEVRLQLFLNRVGQDNQWVELLLRGTTTNRDGVGARVTLAAGGITQMREVKGGGRHSNAQGTRVVHFGLGQESSIDSVTVRWAGGEEEAFLGVTPGMRFRLEEGSGVASPLP